jgi:hypothetical protein
MSAPEERPPVEAAPPPPPADGTEPHQGEPAGPADDEYEPL